MIQDVTQSASALSPYRILDLTDEGCLACGKILADLGAEVIKIERPGGDRARGLQPFYKDKPDPEGSLLCFAFNQGKKGITLNLEHEKGKTILRSLVKAADMVVESFQPGYLDSLGLGYEQLSKDNPGIVFTSITGFGQDGPYGSFKSSDLTVTALSGYLFLCGDPARPPARISVPIAFYLASAEAAASSLIALYHSKRTGQGQRVDVSAQQTYSVQTMNAPAFWDLARRLISRSGQNRGEITSSVKTPLIWRCKDGWIAFAIYGGQIGARVFGPLVAWMDSEGMAEDWLKTMKWGELDLATLTPEFFDKLQKPLARFFATHTKAEMFQGALERQIILCPVNTAGEILDDRQLEARQFWVQVSHPELDTTIKYPGAFARLSETPVKPGTRAPLLGEHNYAVYQGLLGLSHIEIDKLKKEGVI